MTASRNLAGFVVSATREGYWVDKISYHRPHDPKESSYDSSEELHAALDDLLKSPRHIEWKGIDVFGREAIGNYAGGAAPAA